MSDKNYIENNLDPNWDQNEDKAFNEFLVKKIVFLCDHIWNNVSQSQDFREDNIYSGNVGIAYMFWHLSQQKTFLSDKQRESCLFRARALILRSLNAMVDQRIEKSHSFLFGYSGICLIAGIVFHSCDDYKSRDHYLNLFVKFSAYYPIIDYNNKLRDTLFEGRAGFICAALTANQTFGKFNALMTKSDLPLVYESINGVGVSLSQGMSGVLLSLLCIPDLKLLHPDFEPHIKQAVDYILSKQSSNGSYISEELDFDPIDWCSGSTGVCFLMAKAYQFWSEDKYKNSFIRCGEMLWNRGLSRRGPGISIGSVGNGYVFLLLYRCTGDKKYLIRAKRFAQIIFKDSYLNQCLSPQRPYSLMEGWAGTVCYLTSLMSPESTQMPLFFDIFDKQNTELTEDFASLSDSLQEIHSIKSIELINKTQNKSTVERIKH